MNSGLIKTFNYLSSTHNEASIDVLVDSFGTDDSDVSTMCVQALVKRNSESSFKGLLELWDRMPNDDRQILADPNTQIGGFVTHILGDQKHPHWHTASEMALELSLFECMPNLITKAESSSNVRIRKRSLAVAIALAEKLGLASRKGLDRPLIRKKTLERLGDSVGRHEFHKVDGLVDAFLCIATWSDTPLLAMLAENGKNVHLITQRLANSELLPVVDLLAGWISKRRIPTAISPLLKTRKDKKLGEQLLRHISKTPAATTLRNLEALGQLASLSGHESGFGDIRPAQKSAMLYALASWKSDRSKVVARALDLIEQGDSDSARSACMVIRRIEPISEPDLLREAIQIAGIVSKNPDSSLLKQSIVWRQIQLLDHPVECIRTTMRDSLDTFTVPRLFEYASTMSVESRRKVGSLISLVDEDARPYISDAMRHPVLKQRLRALDAIIAIDCVDFFFDVLREAFEREHLEGKIKIVEALRWGAHEESYAWLAELSRATSGPIRDVAIQSMETREDSKPIPGAAQ